MVVVTLGRLDLEKIWREINCLYPFYAEDGGNYTKIILDSGKELIDQRKTKTVLKDLANFFTVDLKSIRTKYGVSIDRKKGIPIPFHGELVLIAVRVREPQSKDQGAVAYVNTQKVDLIKEAKDASGFRTQILFRNQHSIKSMQNSISVKALLKDADLVRISYLNLYRTPAGKDLLLKESLTNFLDLISRIS